MSDDTYDEQKMKIIKVVLCNLRGRIADALPVHQCHKPTTPSRVQKLTWNPTCKHQGARRGRADATCSVKEDLHHG
jgi:hypothetical protein